MSMVSDVGFYVMIVLYALMAIGFIAFYTWLALYMRGDKARAYCQTRN